MQIKAFFDKATFTLTYVVYDEMSRDAIIIDPVLDFDPSSGRLTRSSADEVLAFVSSSRLRVRYLIETHAHADHLSAAQLLKEALPGVQLAISAQITQVQQAFRMIYNLSQDFAVDGSQFDRLFHDGERIQAGTLSFDILATPGHTPACASYDFGGRMFVGDLIFMPDFGTGRCDFPGGSAKDLYHSVQRLYHMPDTTIMFTGHDYQPNGRPLRYEASLAEQKRDNIQLKSSTSLDEFVKFRTTRDANLATPRLLHPSVQVNINGGHLPAVESNAMAYLRIPLYGLTDLEAG